MSQIPLSSLLSQVGAVSDGSAKLRPAASRADESARQDFASLIAGRMHSSSSSSGSTSVDGAGSAAGASNTASVVAAPENSASAFAQVFSQVSASNGRVSRTESSSSAASSGEASAPLLKLVAQMRALLAQIRGDASGADGTGASKVAGASAGASTSVDGMSLTDAIRALKDLFVKAGITPSAVAEAKSTTTKSTGHPKAEGVGDGQTAGEGLASLLSLMHSLQAALRNQAQRIAQGAEVATTGGSAQLAALQQLQQQLQVWGKQVEQLQQSGQIGRADLRTVLAQLQTALSTQEDGTRSAKDERVVTTAASQVQARQASVSTQAGDASKSALDTRQPDWLAALRQQNAQMHARAAQHAGAQGQANRELGANANQGASTTSSLTAAALSAAHGSSANATAATVGAQGLLGAALGRGQERDSGVSGSGLTNTAAVGGASLSGVASALTSLTGAQASTGVFGTGGAQPHVNPQLASGVGQQIQWMVGKNISSASINVTPADLGPLKIHVQMQQDGGLQVQLMAHQHMTRDMLEQSLPRLRDWLQEAGLGQANVSVSPDTSGDAGAQLAQQQGQGSGSSAGGFGMTSALSGSADLDGGGHDVRVLQGPVTLLDLFA